MLEAQSRELPKAARFPRQAQNASYRSALEISLDPPCKACVL